MSPTNIFPALVSELSSSPTFGHPGSYGYSHQASSLPTSILLPNLGHPRACPGNLKRQIDLVYRHSLPFSICLDLRFRWDDTRRSFLFLLSLTNFFTTLDNEHFPSLTFVIPAQVGIYQRTSQKVPRLFYLLCLLSLFIVPFIHVLGLAIVLQLSSSRKRGSIYNSEKLLQVFDAVFLHFFAVPFMHALFFVAVSKVTIFFTLSNIHLGPSDVSWHRQAA